MVRLDKRLTAFGSSHSILFEELIQILILSMLEIERFGMSVVTLHSYYYIVQFESIKIEYFTLNTVGMGRNYKL